MNLSRLRKLAGIILEGLWNGHEIVSNRKTPKGNFIVIKNKNDGKLEIHKENKAVNDGYEFVSAHETPEEMLTSRRAVAARALGLKPLRLTDASDGYFLPRALRSK